MAKRLLRNLLRRTKPAAADPVPASAPEQLPSDTAGSERVPQVGADSGEAAAARERTLAEYLGDAVELRNAGRFDQADVLLAEAIERFPEEPRPRFEWALLPHFRLDWAEAARRSELVREQFPDAAATHALAAIVLRELGRMTMPSACSPPPGSDSRKICELPPKAPGWPPISRTGRRRCGGGEPCARISRIGPAATPGQR